VAQGETYEQFVEKFKPKHTTDDCYTPANIYETVKDWACNEYGIEPDQIVRPFWPGGDYENFYYPENCVVLDNPPFSIQKKILDFYNAQDIKFFLFANALTIFSSTALVRNVSHICVGNSITFENGANIGISYLTNLGGPYIRTAPELYKAIDEAEKENRAKVKKHVNKYRYPRNVLTAATLTKLSRFGVDFTVNREQCHFIRRLESQREKKKAIFGGGYLVADSVAQEAERAKQEAERAKQEAERATTTVWTLSDEEKSIIKNLNRKSE
jgi:hypothetical protein